MSIKIGKIPIKIHGILPLLWLFAWITGTGKGLLPTFLALILHESGHLLAAKLLKMRVDSIEITPYGGVIAIENMDQAPLVPGFLLAFAGPFFSMVGCLAAALICYFDIASFEFSQSFARGNLILFLLNLLPALPLDGGRMMRCILSRFLTYSKSTRLLTGFGLFLGFLLCGLSVALAFKGQMNLSPMFAGIYILYASTIEQKQGIARYITALIARRQKLENNEIIPVEMIAASENAPVISLLGRLNAGKYHRIIVLAADGMKALGIVEEEALCSAALETPDEELKSILKNGQKRF